MKKLFLLFSLTVALAFTSNGQTVYHPFPDSDAVWNQEYIGDDYPTCHSTANFSYTINGDIIRNSLIYHKICFSYIKWVYNNPYCMLGPQYCGAIRQDTSLRQVFYISDTSSTEDLLYDFNLKIGDTLHSRLYTNNPVLLAIGSILVDTSYRILQQFHTIYNPNTAEVIEGIGCLKGLLELGFGCLDGCGYQLNCFQQNGKTLYPDTTTSCNIISSVNNLPEKNISITLSPNPFHTTAMLEIRGLTPNPSPKERGEELKIYDVMGRLAQSQVINSQSTIINRDLLGDGLYFYQLRTNDYELIGGGKFVVE